MRPQKFKRQARERRDEGAAGLHPLGWQRPMRPVFARSAHIAQLPADHASHHARPRRCCKDEAKRGGSVARDVEPIRLVQPDLPNFVGAQEAVALDNGAARGRKIGEGVDGDEPFADLASWRPVDKERPPYRRAIPTLLGAEAAPPPGDRMSAASGLPGSYFQPRPLVTMRIAPFTLCAPLACINCTGVAQAQQTLSAPLALQQTALEAA